MCVFFLACDVSVLIYAGDISLQATNGLQFNILPVSIQVATPSRAMQLGGVDSGTKLSLDNVELSRVYTTNTLTFGGVFTSYLAVDGVSLSNNASMVALWSLSSGSSSYVRFSGGVSNFTQPLDVRSVSDIFVSTNVTGVSSGILPASTFLYTNTFVSSSVNLVLSLIADTDCDNVGDVVLDVTTRLRSSNYPLLIQSHDVNVSGLLDAGASYVRIGSCPGLTRVVDVGGSGLGSGDLRISEYELSLIRSTNFTIQTSGTGSLINVYTVTAVDVSGISDSVILDARVTGSSLSFLQTSEWRGLRGYGGSGITINGNISTTLSQLMLDGNADSSGSDTITFQSGSLWLSAGGGLTSQLILQPSASGSIVGIAPLYLSGSNGVQLMAPTYISSGSGVVRLNSDSDGDGLGLLIFGPSGSMNVNLLSGRYVRILFSM